ncbi:hypothetical protein SUGI_0040070 [Cryptomeria japonica]|nr:hypothetical protein SUGI_0040070 [Cryptomeria japonica]
MLPLQKKTRSILSPIIHSILRPIQLDFSSSTPLPMAALCAISSSDCHGNSVELCTAEERGLSPMYVIHPVEDCPPEFVSEVHLEEETYIESLPSDILVSVKFSLLLGNDLYNREPILPLTILPHSISQLSPAFQLCISVTLSLSRNHPGIHTINISRVPPGAKLSSSAPMPYALLCSKDVLNRMRYVSRNATTINGAHLWEENELQRAMEMRLNYAQQKKGVEDCRPGFVSKVHLEEETNIESLP